MTSQDTVPKPSAPRKETPMTDARTCNHCKATAEQLGPIGMWQHCPEHEGGSLTHEWPEAQPSVQAQASEEAREIVARLTHILVKCPKGGGVLDLYSIDVRFLENLIGKTLDRVGRERERLALERAAKAIKACEAVDAYYSASLDHQPPYVRLARAALEESK